MTDLFTGNLPFYSKRPENIVYHLTLCDISHAHESMAVYDIIFSTQNIYALIDAIKKEVLSEKYDSDLKRSLGNEWKKFASEKIQNYRNDPNLVFDQPFDFLRVHTIELNHLLTIVSE